MSYPATEPTTLAELLQARYDAVRAALYWYRQAVALHAKNPKRLQALTSQRYWTTKAYQYHGEIMTYRDPKCFY